MVRPLSPEVPHEERRRSCYWTFYYLGKRSFIQAQDFSAANIFFKFLLVVFEFSVFTENVSTEVEKLKHARDEFVSQWGALGTQWGINRTMAQIHALLMTAPQSMTTDEVMEELQISRGNAHSNLKELVAWGLIRVVVKKGERREFFEAEKDVWHIFTIVARERKRREIEPTLGILSK
jgi:predicted transcriptional regulator